MNLKGFVAIQDEKGTAKTDEMFLLNMTDNSIKETTEKIDSQVIGVGRFINDGLVVGVTASGDVPLNPTLTEFAAYLVGAGYKGKNGESNKINFKATDSFEKYLTFGLSFQSNNMKKVAQDCLINDLSLKLAMKSYVELGASILSLKQEATTGLLEPTIIENNGKKLTCLGIVLKSGGVDISSTEESVDLKLSNGLELKTAINEIYPTEIEQKSRGSITVNISFNKFDTAKYLEARDLLLKNQATSLEIILSEETNKIKRNTTEDKKVIIKLENIKINNLEITDLQGSGGITQEFSVYPNADGQPMLIEFNNVELDGIVE